MASNVAGVTEVLLIVSRTQAGNLSVVLSVP